MKTHIPSAKLLEKVKIQFGIKALKLKVMNFKFNNSTQKKIKNIYYDPNKPKKDVNAHFLSAFLQSENSTVYNGWLIMAQGSCLMAHGLQN